LKERIWALPSAVSRSSSGSGDDSVQKLKPQFFCPFSQRPQRQTEIRRKLAIQNLLDSQGKPRLTFAFPMTGFNRIRAGTHFCIAITKDGPGNELVSAASKIPAGAV
jgi:hypothetical protein